MSFKVPKIAVKCSRRSVIKRPTYSTTGTASGQTDTTSGQTSITSGKTNGQTRTTSGKTSTVNTTSGQVSIMSDQMSFASTTSDKTSPAIIITLNQCPL